MGNPSTQSVGPLTLAELAATCCLWLYPCMAFLFSRIRAALVFVEATGLEEWCSKFVKMTWLLQLYCIGEYGYWHTEH